MISASIKRNGTLSSFVELDETKETGFLIKRDSVQAAELNEIDYVSNFSVGKTGVLTSFEFIEE